MALTPSDARVRPYAGRDLAFAEAMARAEEKARPKREEPVWVGRTPSGLLRHRDGRLVQRGPLFDANEFNALPLIDQVSGQRFYHGGPAGLAVGSLLTPSTWRGVPNRRLAYAHLARGRMREELVEELVGRHQPDRVYVTTRVKTAEVYAMDGGSVYEVRPLGDLQPDHDLRDSYTCTAALVLAVISTESPETRDLYQQAVPFFWWLLDLLPDRPGVHGKEHWQRVFMNAVVIGQLTEGADPFVLAAFAALHDACRESDDSDAEHGARAATLARALATSGSLPLTPDQLELLCRALIDHDRGLLSIDPTIGACWDSDRLDLPRVGIEVDPRLLSTDAARELIS